MRAFIRFLRLVVSVTAAILIIGTLGLGAVYFYFASDLPNITSFKDYRPPVVSEVFDDNGANHNVFTLRVPALKKLTERAFESQIVVPLTPREQELVIKKQSASAFFSTAHPVKIIFAVGFVLWKMPAQWRDSLSALCVTVHVFSI